jgi:hypothetical protein
VKEITTGRPTAAAARATPMASSAYVIVMADTMWAPASANARACSPW